MEKAALARAYSLLPPRASRGRRTAARDSRVCVAFAAADAARSATSTPNASHAFSAAGRVPLNSERALTSQYVRACETDVEREEEAKTRERLHTGSRVLTAPELRLRLGSLETYWERRNAGIEALMQEML
jgi:hypothetical protein